MDNNNTAVSKMDDLFQLGSQGRLLLRDQVTPHKVAMVVLMRDYCIKMFKPRDQVLVDLDEEYSEKEERDFIFTLLQLIQSADLELKELVQRVQQVAKPRLLESLLQELQDLSKDVRSIMDLFQTLPHKLYLDSLPLLHKTSVLGLFGRRMVLAFDKLSFSQVSKLFEHYKAYYNSWAKMQEKITDDDVLNGSDGDTSLSLMDLVGPGEDKMNLSESGKCNAQETSMADMAKYSQRQAEFFIAQQGALLQHNEIEAMSPKKLQMKVTELLTGNPELAEAHFLSYMNNLRVLEYCGAVDSLHHYFDRQPSSNVDTTMTSSKGKVEDEPSIRGFRYAALNMAALQYRFGHRSEALAAIQEAIGLAQQASDHVCLQHALSWLQRLGEAGGAGPAYLLERLMTKAGELNLPYLTSLGVQAFAQHNALSVAPPSSVFEFLVKSDVVNCQHSQADLMCGSYAQKAALWHLYGNREMCSLSTQLMLNLNTMDLGVYHNGEAECLALCHLARLHASQGEYSWASLIVNSVKKRFPGQSQHSQIWMLCEQQLLFDHALLHRKWSTAEQVLVNMAAVNPIEASFSQAVLLKEKGESDTAHRVLQQLLDKHTSKEDVGQNWAELEARLLLLKGELFSVAGDPMSATEPLLTCLTLAKQHHFTYLVALATLHLAFVQFVLGLPQRALLLLEEVLVPLLTHGSVYDCARAHYLWARCQVAAAAKKDDIKKHKALLSAVEMLQSVIRWFQQAEANFHTKDAIYYLARVYHQLGFVAERNKYALEFRRLDQEYPTWLQSQSLRL